MSNLVLRCRLSRKVGAAGSQVGTRHPRKGPYAALAALIRGPFRSVLPTSQVIFSRSTNFAGDPGTSDGVCPALSPASPATGQVGRCGSLIVVVVVLIILVVAPATEGAGRQREQRPEARDGADPQEVPPGDRLIRRGRRDSERLVVLHGCPFSCRYGAPLRPCSTAGPVPTDTHGGPPRDAARRMPPARPTGPRG